MITTPHKIILVRHGETDGNVKHFFQVPETPLNEKGLIQARVVSDLLDGFNLKQVLTSDHLRSIQTGEVIKARLNIKVLLTSPLFNERNSGIFRGRMADDVFKEFPESYYVRDTDERSLKPSYKPLNGEDWNDLLERAKLAIEMINNIQAPTVIVSHGLFIRALRARLAGINDFDEANTKFPKMVNTAFIELN